MGLVKFTPAASCRPILLSRSHLTCLLVFPPAGWLLLPTPHQPPLLLMSERWSVVVVVDVLGDYSVQACILNAKLTRNIVAVDVHYTYIFFVKLTQPVT